TAGQLVYTPLYPEPRAQKAGQMPVCVPAGPAPSRILAWMRSFPAGGQEKSCSGLVSMRADVQPLVPFSGVMTRVSFRTERFSGAGVYVWVSPVPQFAGPPA